MEKSYHSIPKKLSKSISNFRGMSLMLIAAKTFNCVIGIESDEFFHSYVHFRQDLVEEKVALSK